MSRYLHRRVFTKGHDRKCDDVPTIKTIIPSTFTVLELLQKIRLSVESDLTISEIDKKKILSNILKIDKIINKEEIVNDSTK